ncbi:MAG: trimethylamine methyltransferase family protein [Pseudomonadota bacterium]
MTDANTETTHANEPRRGSRRGRSERRAARQSNDVQSFPPIERQIPTVELLSDEQLQKIEDNADRILAEVGVEFRDDSEALDMWRAAGASVEAERVRFPKGLCRELMKTAPSSFVQHARNPERNVEIGGNKTVCAPVYGPPFTLTLEGERRYATLADFEDFVKLIYRMPALHHSGGTVCEPVDVPVETRHLDMLYAHIKHSDKPFMGSVTAPERAQDSVDMARILFGEEFVENNCVLTSLININSPLVFDDTMMGALKVYARANQACIVSPFIVGGAMSPVTVGGTLSQVFAESQVAVAFSQLCRPGAPVILGTFATGISMSSGAPAFGTPEPAQVLLGVGQFARKHGLPFRSGGSLTGSKLPDAQAAYESANTLYPAILGGVNFMLHAAGWLEGGLVSSLEKLYMDADQLAAMQKFSAGVDTSDDALAFDAINQVQPGNHFLGCDHTQANFQTAFYRSTVADNDSYEQWIAGGGQDTRARAADKVRAELAAYEAPPLDVEIDAKLRAFMATRKQDITGEAPTEEWLNQAEAPTEKAFKARSRAMREAFGLDGKGGEASE